MLISATRFDQLNNFIQIIFHFVLSNFLYNQISEINYLIFGLHH